MAGMSRFGELFPLLHTCHPCTTPLHSPPAPLYLCSRLKLHCTASLSDMFEFSPHLITSSCTTKVLRSSCGATIRIPGDRFLFVTLERLKAKILETPSAPWGQFHQSWLKFMAWWNWCSFKLSMIRSTIWCVALLLTASWGKAYFLSWPFLAISRHFRCIVAALQLLRCSYWGPRQSLTGVVLPDTRWFLRRESSAPVARRSQLESHQRLNFRSSSRLRTISLRSHLGLTGINGKKRKKIQCFSLEFCRIWDSVIFLSCTTETEPSTFFSPP